jgi:outer membrane protein TolC
MRLTRLLLSLLATWPLAVAPVFAEEAPAPRTLSLAECLKLVLDQNPDLRAQRLATQIEQLDYAQTGHRYGLSLRAGPTVQRAISPTSTSFVSGGSRIEEWTQNYNMQLRQDLMTGGNLAIQASNNIFDTTSTRVDFNPSYQPGLSLVLSQPLLKEWWSGGRTIEIARLDAESARVHLDGQLMKLVADTETAYWNLVAARETIRVRERSLKLVKDLLVINREKAKAGLMARLDVLQAEASQAVREGAYLEAQRDLATAEDQLRRLIDPQFAAETWKQPIQPADRPQFAAREVTFDAVWQTAQAQRPDLRAATLDVLRQNQVVESAGNRLWPKLDLTGSAGVNNLDAHFDKAVGDLSRLQNYRLQAGVVLEYPLGANPDRDEYDKSRLKLEQVTVSQQATQQRAFVEVREAVRDVQIDAKRVEANSLAKKLAEGKLDAEQEKLKAGLSTNFQVLEFQKDFEEASLAEVRSTIEYLQSLTRLEAAQGTLLATRKLMEPTPVVFPAPVAIP